MTHPRNIFQRMYDQLYGTMDIAGLAIVRMLFGIIIIVEAWRYTQLGAIVAKFHQQDFYFKFRYFEWVPAISPYDMQWIFVIYAISGLFICLGIFYHFSMLIAALCISYIFLVDATNYLNHFYLVIVFSFMMLFIPAHKGWSLYAIFNPKKAQSTVPGWSIWLIRLILAIVYCYAGIAKMNVDWINGMPLYHWIGDRAINGEGLEIYLNLPIVIYFFTYGGLFYDLLIAPLLLCRKTRVIGFCLTLFFHLSNYFLFNIGIFPWFMIATTTIFLEPNWPRALLNKIFTSRFLPVYVGKPAPTHLNSWQKLGLLMMVIHISFQALFPLRHFVYPGYAGWDEAGHNFSWHMKLRGKNGKVLFTVKDPKTGQAENIDNRQYLTQRQIDKMASRPYLILQFAHFLRDKYTEPGEPWAEVYVESRVSLNGRKPQRLIDPTVNLSLIEPSEIPKSWVFPLRQPVWNAEHKKNRFGNAVKLDDIALRAVPKLKKNQDDNRAASR